MREFLPFKSPAAALLFSLLLGPIGLLYASFWGGVIMLVVGAIIITTRFIYSIILMWLICVVWAMWSVERHNRFIIKCGNLSRS
jgi:hypothetical protein